ncbi:MAG TPA: alpha-amylase family glycosyl hydrolase [Flavobacterium sp.]|nr:alpha-amylase family glycosyl hydrolase [Flavobacterium sp.]
MKLKTFFFACLLSCIAASAQDEVVYHVFQRSFFDSNNDGTGDLKGINQKLDYLQDLGVTTILLTPLYASDFYHNYFAYDFEKIDPEYGNMSDYAALVREAHKRNMKIYQDVEMQYVAGEHPWFKDSFGNPKSKYSNYLVYLDTENKQPWWFWNFPEFTMYTGEKRKIITVNMAAQAVKDYTFKVLKFWVDPDKNGKFDDGVDGFRLDHMMDNLDSANRLTNLFADFWTPMLSNLRKINPNLKIVAEQANWGNFGHDYLTKGNVDYVFAFRLKFAINSFDKKQIEKAADSTFHFNPSGKNQFVFLENHDTKRFASEKDMTVEKEKAAIGIQLLIGGIPSIYYGQEIGMKGEQKQMGITDGNDIPVREAFDWYASGEGTGMANWYKNTGPWWDQRNQKPNDGISLEEETKNDQSLFHFYKELLALRKHHPGLQTGDYAAAANNNDSVFSFLRTNGNEKYLVLVNLSAQSQNAAVNIGNEKAKILHLYGNAEFKANKGIVEAALFPYSVLVFKIN